MHNRKVSLIMFKNIVGKKSQKTFFIPIKLDRKEFLFFINNILASLVVNSFNEKISLRALKQLHRLTTIDLYRRSLGDVLSDVINNYIYLHRKTSLILDKLVTNGEIEIFFL
ncbi:unnamed protein product [Adineta steineri]|uniref:Uncharacterized protein n=1 Tax=Adineta steineri TaxID=433720 RepID=A0A815RBC3_9BILA|nr:unnamed protein product [Adineta steineri]CAF1474274.1 unnamed protein product [Adineta steineri]